MNRTISEIAPETKRLKDREFVYFLTQNDVVVYVGRTRSLKNRTGRHRPEKEFDGVYYFDAPRSESRVLESALVALLQPEYNGTLGSPLTGKAISLLMSYGVDVSGIRDHPRLADNLKQACDTVDGGEMPHSNTWLRTPIEVRVALGMQEKPRRYRTAV